MGTTRAVNGRVVVGQRKASIVAPSTTKPRAAKIVLAVGRTRLQHLLDAGGFSPKETKQPGDLQANLGSFSKDEGDADEDAFSKKYLYFTFEFHNCVDLLSTPIGLKTCSG